VSEFTVTITGIQQRTQATAITKSLAALWPELTITARKAKPRKLRRSVSVILKKGARQ